MGNGRGLAHRCVSIFEKHTFWCIVLYPIAFYLLWIVVKILGEAIFHIIIQIEINSDVSSNILQDSLNLLMFSVGSLTFLLTILTISAQHENGNLKEEHTLFDQNEEINTRKTSAQKTKRTVWERISNKLRELTEKPWYGELYRQYLYFASFSFISYVLAWIIENTKINMNVDRIIFYAALYTYAVALGFFAVVLLVWGLIIWGISNEISKSNSLDSNDGQEDETTDAEFDHGI